VGVARLRLPEKLARNLNEEELPTLDRPLRFIVTRGVRGAARAATLGELQDELERPFTEKELAEMDRAHEARLQDRKKRRDSRRGGRNGRNGRGGRGGRGGEASSQRERPHHRDRNRKRERDRRVEETDREEVLRDERRPATEGFSGRRREGPGKFRAPRRGKKRR
jgi:hypothetical protein